MWTKRQLAEEALTEIGLAPFRFQVSPEQIASVIRRMDAMAAVWEGKGIRIGYAFPQNPEDSDPDQMSGIPDAANAAVFKNLAVDVAPSYGKQVSQDTKASAKNAYDTLLNCAAYPTQQQMPNTMPRGAGNKPWRTTNQPFFPSPDANPLQITQGGDLRVLPE